MKNYNVFVGAYTKINLNSEIDNHAWIGINNIIQDKTITEGAKIDNFAMQYGTANERILRK